MTFARRDFLRVALGTTGMAQFAGAGNALREGAAANCILLVLTGGPSQLDTWDMKPDAPSEVRGPFRPIGTNVPGMEISEIFPRMARHADKYALIRSVYSDAVPAHEVGLRPIDSLSKGATTLPGPIGFMGGFMDGLGNIAPPASETSPSPLSFSDNCRLARQLVEAGVPFVRVNMFETVFHRVTWDSHGTRPFSTIRDYRDTVGPAFDAAYSTLLEDLSQRGLLKTTLLVATGEFGRTPRINPSGGRDHWTKCWTVLMAGGGVRGGQVYGSSDALGAEPKDKPVSAARIIATMQHVLGMRTGAEPVRELFG